MKKVKEFFKEYGTLVLVCLVMIVWIKSCSVGRSVKRTEKNVVKGLNEIRSSVDTMRADGVTKTDLRIEGLKAEKRMIQSTDRKKFDLDRENEIDKEIKALEGR